ncbi:XylR N-terminal domain-containing protein [Bacillus sp. JJ1764]|uniref:XylR N-terminal domain-containing protein n=1 Tax=Bacillus sp. JJ1764 TaxID=3122964 RepID=UPI002FFE364C
MRIVIRDEVKSIDENEGILSSVSAFALLREELIKNIGMDRVKGFLLRYGYELGANAGKNALALGFSRLEEVIKQGPDFHSTYGHVKGVNYSINMDFDQNDQDISSSGKGTWEGSFEGLEHLKRFGRSESPICYTLRGYVSGFMSTICKQTIIAKETSCIAMGDPVCSWEFKPLADWGSEITEEYQYYSESPIIKDYKYTYQQLLEQRNYMYQVANLHKKLTESVTNGCDLQMIADIANEITGFPIMIDDVSFQTSVYSGMTNADFQEIMDDIKLEFRKADEEHQHQNERPDEFLLSFGKKCLKTQHHRLLLAPITVRKKILGYCSFIYTKIMEHNVEHDFMLLERIANAASLFFLNEKTSFESFERMKGNFLEQLLNNQYSSKTEILKRGRFMNIDLRQKYYIGVLEVKHHKISIDHELVLHEQLLESTITFFKEQKHTVLAVQKQGRIVFLIPVLSKKDSIMAGVVEAYVKFLEKTFAHTSFKLGISSKGELIEQAFKYYEEALIASRMVTKKKVQTFDSLGIVGILINQNNIAAVKKLAHQLLGVLYENNDPKSAELIKTLYVFLLNGGKLEQTMKDLSLSMTGLLYRIQKIEMMIGKDLRNPLDSHHVFLVLEALVSLGELEI